MKPSPYVVRRGAGLPLLFVHGNSVDHQLLLALDDLFAEPGVWERVYVDLPGFGRTPALDGTGGLPEIADWLAAVVDEEVGDGPFAIVGNSLGGLLARDLVSRRPGQVAGFALLVPVVDSLRANRTLPPRTLLRRDEALLAGLDPDDAELYAELSVVQSASNWERFRDAALPGLRAADADAGERLSASYALPSLPDEKLVGFDRPVLIVTGRQDHVVGYVDQLVLAEQFPRCTYAVLDAAGHNVHLDQPEAVRGLLAAWSDDVLRTSADIGT